VIIRIYFAVAPKQWEGRIFEFLGTSEADVTEFRIGKESYDAVNLRRRYIEEQLEGIKRDFYDYLFLHKTVGRPYGGFTSVVTPFSGRRLQGQFADKRVRKIPALRKIPSC